MTERKSRPPKSRREPAAPSLDTERDAFIQTFIRKGVRLTQELVRENEELRKRAVELEAENAQLKIHLRRDDAIRELLTTIEKLEQEKSSLLSRFKEVEARSNAFEMTYTEVEAELSNLASLYVAARQLHATPSVPGVLRHLKEILEQLIGARAYAVYARSEAGTELLPIFHQGLDEADVHAVRPGEGAIGQAFSRAAGYVSEEDTIADGTFANPAACVPLKLDERVVGVLAVFHTFEQKNRFLSVDFEFFKLLGGQAAEALLAAALLARADGKLPGAELFLELGV